MSYAEGDMAEPQEQFSTSEDEDTEARIGEHETRLLKRFADVLPELSEEQVKKLMPAVRETAQEFVATKDAGEIDLLTELPNRRGFDNRLDHEFRRRTRYLMETGTKTDGTGAFLYLELDDFGAVNKIFDDQTGDEVLKQVAKILKNLRAGEITARWGGDEFLIYTPHYFENAIKMAIRLQQEIPDAVTFPDPSRKQTISVGIRPFPAGLTSEQLTDPSFSAELHTRLIHESSVAMRKGAREKGPNRIAVMDEIGKLNLAVLERNPADPTNPIIRYQPVTSFK